MNDVIDPLTFHERLGASSYDMIVRALQWAGPADMERILTGIDLKGAVVADVGIGSGQLSRFFNHRGANHIVGIDGVNEFLNVCVKNGLADEIHQCNVAQETLPLDDNSVDLCTASGLFSYISDVYGLVGEMVRITKNEGYIAVNFHPTEHNNSTEFLSAAFASRSAAAPSVVRAYSYSATNITDLFEDAGAKLQQMHVNKHGIVRGHSGEWKSLNTALYQKRSCRP